MPIIVTPLLLTASLYHIFEGCSWRTARRGATSSQGQGTLERPSSCQG